METRFLILSLWLCRSLSPPLPSPSFYFFPPLQLTVIESGPAASCALIPTDSPPSSIAPDYVAITSRPGGIRGACVKVTPCEKTPACSQRPPTGGGASGALQLTLCLESTSAPSGRTEA